MVILGVSVLLKFLPIKALRGVVLSWSEGELNASPKLIVLSVYILSDNRSNLAYTKGDSSKGNDSSSLDSNWIILMFSFSFSKGTGVKVLA